MVDYYSGLKSVPAAIGPYSQATKAGGMIFLSGQIPLDPDTGKLVADDITAQTEQVMKNLSSALSGVGSGFDKVCMTTILLTSMSDFQTVNQIYTSWMKEAKPARMTYAVSALPAGAKIEIAMVAQG